ncbi:hypothetical protein RhiirA4_549014 [Rhizophagus irregularis]|uniref:Uncharacterized protein n=1 Tax=Rhizophagus irregularis TaxID=588596 RepID=A0A2I1HAS9_9GLOM|nr:hypothetical protein RhiirA4_549014 [Rhizophagus irregularis]
MDPNFWDFLVRREKQTIKFYRDIDIDDEILQTLPESGSIVEKLPQFTDNRTNSSEEEPDDEDENENDENSFNSQTLPTRLNEDRAINEILN